MLSQLQHGSLVSFVFIADEGARLSVFMEWAGDSLRGLFAGQQQQACSEGLAQSIMFQLVSAVASLHSQVSLPVPPAGTDHVLLAQQRGRNVLGAALSLTCALTDWLR